MNGLAAVIKCMYFLTRGPFTNSMPVYFMDRIIHNDSVYTSIYGFVKPNSEQGSPTNLSYGWCSIRQLKSYQSLVLPLQTFRCKSA